MTQQQNENYRKIREAVSFIQSKSSLAPEVGITLGSGLGNVADRLKDAQVIPYADIPHFFATGVEGHAGRLLLGTLEGVPTVVLQGRFHFYEGHNLQSVVFPTRVICSLGIKTLVLTNASGGVNTRFRPGDIMAITDHVNFTGNNPLIGPNISELGPRFPDSSEIYSKNCLELLEAAAKETSILLQTGVYGGVLGPSYETPAEVKMLRSFGVDAVGMSTVSEAIAASHMGVPVCGLACITNLAAGLSTTKLTHEEVVENSKLSVGKLEKLLLALVPKLGAVK